jgi:mono/diheme cytochrome c family protein
MPAATVIRSDGALTTQKFLVTRLPDADVAAIANAWAARARRVQRGRSLYATQCARLSAARRS